MTTISKTTFTFIVLHQTDEPFSDGYDSGYDGPFCGTLADAMQRSWDGNAVGALVEEDTVPVEYAEVEHQLLQLGNDGTFFDDTLLEHTCNGINPTTVEDCPACRVENTLNEEA